MKSGNSVENMAIAEYKNIQSRCLDSLKVEICGFYISQETPFIAGTPDATVSCKCCLNGFLEVKNPFSASILDYVKLKNSCLKNEVPLLWNLAPNIFTFCKVLYFLAKIQRNLLYCLYFYVT